eukprot:c28512_g1_i1 orf=114-2699(+)
MDPGSLLCFLVLLLTVLICFPPCGSVSSLIYPLLRNWTSSCNVSPSQNGVSLQPIVVSANQRFAWGFVSSPQNSQLRTSCSLSAVCYNCAEHYIAWTAKTKSSPVGNVVVQVGNDGVVELWDTAGSVLWSTGARGVKGIQMLDSGNLVMFNDSNATVWQTFDNPTDVLLPGQSLRTGMRLTAGDYSAVMEQGGLALYVRTPQILPYLVLNASWGLDTLDNVLNPVCLNALTIEYAVNGETLIMEQRAVPQQVSSHPYCVSVNETFNKTVTTKIGANGFRYLKLKEQGDLQTFVNDQIDFIWFNEDIDNNGYGFCNLPSHCGQFGVCDPGGECRCPQLDSNESPDYIVSQDYSVEESETTGCQEVQAANCSDGSGSHSYKLLQLSDLDYFPHRYLSQNHTRSTLHQCVESCEENCSCVAVFYNNITQFCHSYESVLSMQRTRYGNDYMVFVKVLPPSEASHSRKSTYIYVGIGAAFLIVLASISIWRCRSKRRAALKKSEDDDFLESLSGLPPRFSVKQLTIMTNGFTVKLGAGGFGSVYQGSLPDGSKIAVKKLEGSSQGDKEFRAEVAALGGLSHVNLVHLRGFCAEGSHRMLVYEYMPNGSLDRWLYNRGDHERPSLDWNTRLGIAIDAAKGLAFLHGESRERIFHLDIKPQNILLDDNFVAKLSDFGLSKQVDRNQSTAITSMRGTPGYLAPEWLLQLAVTDKSDVYSYGMVFLEILSGRRNMDYSYTSDKCYFPAWVLHMAQTERWEEAAEDVYLGSDSTGCNLEQAVKAIKVALWCLQEDPKLRPSMNSVWLMLEGHMEVTDPPTTMQFILAYQARISASLGDTRLSCDSSNPDLPSTNCVSSGDGLLTRQSLLTL